MANERSTSDALSRMGPWLSNDASKSLPNMRRSFDLNRDEYIRAQLLNQPVKQKQQGGDSEGRGSSMIKADKPYPAPAPKGQMRKFADRAGFSGRWLAEQREAVMSRVVNNQHHQSPAQTPVKTLKPPSL